MERVESSKVGANEGDERFWRKTKRPRLGLSLGTSVDQPSPKCCSRSNVLLPPNWVNGSPVLHMARKWGIANALKIKEVRPRFRRMAELFTEL